jgi:hypothetical protein
MTPEGEIQAYLKRRVEALGGQFRKLAWTGRRGAPDCLIWWPGPFFAFVEVKAAGGRLSTLQTREIDRLRAAGFQVAVVFCKEDADEVVFALTQPFGCIQ